MKPIELSKGKLAIVDDEDLALVSRYSWHVVNVGGREYTQASIWTNGRSKNIYMHRLIMGFPSGKDIDHANHNTLDNRKCNLRECTRSQNHFNRLKGISKSKFKGVSLVSWTTGGEHFHNGKWRARIKVNREEKHIGCYGTEEAAARAYDEAAINLFGDFALLNFPKIKEAI
jgi:hypothetical protein